MSLYLAFQELNDLLKNGEILDFDSYQEEIRHINHMFAEAILGQPALIVFILTCLGFAFSFIVKLFFLFHPSKTDINEATKLLSSGFPYDLCLVGFVVLFLVFIITLWIVCRKSYDDRNLPNDKVPSKEYISFPTTYLKCIASTLGPLLLIYTVVCLVGRVDITFLLISEFFACIFFITRFQRYGSRVRDFYWRPCPLFRYSFIATILFTAIIIVLKFSKLNLPYVQWMLYCTLIAMAFYLLWGLVFWMQYQIRSHCRRSCQNTRKNLNTASNIVLPRTASVWIARDLCFYIASFIVIVVLIFVILYMICDLCQKFPTLQF